MAKQYTEMDGGARISYWRALEARVDSDAGEEGSGRLFGCDQCYWEPVYIWPHENHKEHEGPLSQGTGGHRELESVTILTDSHNMS